MTKDQEKKLIELKKEARKAMLDYQKGLIGPKALREKEEAYKNFLKNIGE